MTLPTMNYEKIYNNFIIDFINTDVKTRIIRRNPRDLRLILIIYMLKDII